MEKLTVKIEGEYEALKVGLARVTRWLMTKEEGDTLTIKGEGIQAEAVYEKEPAVVEVDAQAEGQDEPGGAEDNPPENQRPADAEERRSPEAS
jgi:hypothetical protein